MILVVPIHDILYWPSAIDLCAEPRCCRDESGRQKTNTKIPTTTVHVYTTAFYNISVYIVFYTVIIYFFIFSRTIAPLAPTTALPARDIHVRVSASVQLDGNKLSLTHTHTPKQYPGAAAVSRGTGLVSERTFIGPLMGL